MRLDFQLCDITRRLPAQGWWRFRSKHTAWGPLGIYLATLLVALASATVSHAAGADTRNCIRQAASQAAILACEQEAQQTALTNITHHLRLLDTQLSARGRHLLDQAQQRWQAYLDAELLLLDRVARARADGLAGILREGNHTQLLEQRAAQLEQHLHNLSKQSPAADSQPVGQP